MLTAIAHVQGLAAEATEAELHPMAVAMLEYATDEMSAVVLTLVKNGNL